MQEINQLFGTLVSESFLTSQRYSAMGWFGWSGEKLVLKASGCVDLGWLLRGEEQEFLFVLCFY